MEAPQPIHGDEWEKAWWFQRTIGRLDGERTRVAEHSGEFN